MTITPLSPAELRINPVALRLATLDHIRANPAEWTQGEWRCGTGMCYAGTATALAGGTYPYPASSDRNYYVNTPTGRRRTISNWAAELLAVDDDQNEMLTDAEVLFSGFNTLADLEHMVARLNHHLPLFDEGGALAASGEWANLDDAPLDPNGRPILTPANT